MIAKLTGIVAALILCGWLYFLTLMVMRCLTHAEATNDTADRILTAAHTLLADRPAPHPVAYPPTVPGAEAISAAVEKWRDAFVFAEGGRRFHRADDDTAEEETA